MCRCRSPWFRATSCSACRRKIWARSRAAPPMFPGTRAISAPAAFRSAAWARSARPKRRIRSVGIIVDGVSYAYNPLSSSYNFIDVDTVEVTRGPQGTLMGKSASLGVVSIRTKRPTFDPTADYSVSYGDDDALHGWFAGGGGIIDDVLAWRTTRELRQSSRATFSNRYNPDNTYQNKDRISGRVQFLYTPTEDFSGPGLRRCAAALG